MDIYDVLSSNLFSVPASTNIEYTMGGLRTPLNALVLLPFILFRNIQRHRTRNISAGHHRSNQDSLIPIRIRVRARLATRAKG